MSLIKYSLFPGKIRSKSDGQVHYISAHQLADLYGVPMSECQIMKSEPGEVQKGIGLYPDYHGVYKLPNVN